MPIEIEGKRDLMGGIARALPGVSHQAVVEEAQAVVHIIHDEMTQDPKNGRIYTAGPPPLPHQASAPGEPPASWTGNLLRSIELEPVADGEVDIRIGADYAPVLEFGGVHSPPRPFLQPALEAVAPRFVTAVGTELSKEFH